MQSRFFQYVPSVYIDPAASGTGAGSLLGLIAAEPKSPVLAEPQVLPPPVLEGQIPETGGDCCDDDDDDGGED